ncbi:hypothetical protein GC105_08870 [Alkalibaculum sp. M08DMB]|uniref:Uncharacterized protein n=1 Tax=Alkalibaculum sporogenes TaxID=2655001 RepID=A0A6A7K9B3_9FIRM|nr:hypothetical protein [Alkalibaculum sporogenes]MPW25901.1 hypothetical protein [Alkalibaculum sporogenes]
MGKENIKTFISKKRLTLLICIFLILLLIWLTPFIYTKFKLSALHVEEVSKIVYVQYEGMPLSSKINIKKYFSVNEDKLKLEEFVTMFENGKYISKKTNPKTSEMFFLYFEDDTVVNAYVVDNTLGFQYGEYWVNIEGLEEFMSSMKPMELIEISGIVPYTN